MQAVQAAQELHICTLWAADSLHQFIGDFFVHCLQPFQVKASKYEQSLPLTLSCQALRLGEVTRGCHWFCAFVCGALSQQQSAANS
jgi:hypothetical protein